MHKKITLLLLLCTVFLSLVACQAQPREIKLDRFVGELGLYQYSDVAWGSSPAEMEKWFGKSLGEAVASYTGVNQYVIDGLFVYKGVKAQAACEFYNDKLYEMSFTFYASDVKDIDLDMLFADITEVLIVEYGNADTEQSVAPSEFLGDTYDIHYYTWEATAEKQHTVLQLTKSIRNGRNHSVVLYVNDISLSPKQISD